MEDKVSCKEAFEQPDLSYIQSDLLFSDSSTYNRLACFCCKPSSLQEFSRSTLFKINEICLSMREYFVTVISLPLSGRTLGIR